MLRYGIATLKHENCSANSTNIVNESLELAVISSCPKFAIDATYRSNLRLGDDLVVHGYSTWFSFYRGYVNCIDNNEFRIFPHLQKNAQTLYIFLPLSTIMMMK
jgi:hypothetical protein